MHIFRETFVALILNTKTRERRNEKGLYPYITSLQITIRGFNTIPLFPVSLAQRCARVGPGPGLVLGWRARPDKNFQILLSENMLKNWQISSKNSVLALNCYSEHYLNYIEHFRKFWKYLAWAGLGTALKIFWRTAPPKWRPAHISTLTTNYKGLIHFLNLTYTI